MQVMRAAKEAMISEFGQTPCQLFDDAQPHPARHCMTPALTLPLPGYCGTPSSGEEVSQSLVHILLEVAKSENVQSVLASPGKLQPVRSPRRLRDAPTDGRCRLSSCPEGMPPTAAQSAGSFRQQQRPASAGARPGMPVTTGCSPLRASLQPVRKSPLRKSPVHSGAFYMGALLSSLSHINGVQHSPLHASSRERSAGSGSACLPCMPGEADDLLPEAGPVSDSEGDCPTIQVPRGLAPFDTHVALGVKDAAVELGGARGGLDIVEPSEEASTAEELLGAGADETAGLPAMGVAVVAGGGGRTESEGASREEGLENGLCLLGGNTGSAGEPQFWPARMHDRLQVLAPSSCLTACQACLRSAARGSGLPALSRGARLCVCPCDQA